MSFCVQIHSAQKSLQNKKNLIIVQNSVKCTYIFLCCFKKKSKKCNPIIEIEFELGTLTKKEKQSELAVTSLIVTCIGKMKG